MTKEEKQLLLKDLCARLPYGVKVQVYSGNMYAPAILTSIDVKKQECIFNFNVPVEYCLPYLRPMSSMTKEELKEYDKATDIDVADSAETLKVNLEAKSRVRVSKWYHGNDWLNEHHFDYRDLISMGLALKAPEGMYNS